jgi:hypothetical protein
MNIPLFAVYSCVNNVPRIHQVLATEQEAKDKLLEYVYLLTKSESISTDPSVFPCLTYKVLENKSIEIHEHSKVEKIKKGWVWDRKKSEIETITIGSFQVISIENDFVIPVLETNKLVNKLIDEMINNICDIKIDLEYEKEAIKNLDQMFVPFLDEVRSIKTDPVETIKDLSPSPENENVIPAIHKDVDYEKEGVIFSF